MTEQILYDLIVNEEWPQPSQSLNEVENYFWQHRGSLFTKLWKLTHGSWSFLLKVLRTQFRNGKYVAILQDDVIEIRSSNNNFSNIVAYCKVEHDSLPQWRRLTWDDERYILAYANSFGDLELFDLTGSSRCAIRQPTSKNLKVPATLSHAAAFLHFTASDDVDWDLLLYMATYHGYLKCYYVKEDGTYKEKFNFTFMSYHPYGISSVLYDEKSNLFIVAGNYGKEPFISDDDSPCYGSHCAISVWRLLTDLPYLTIVEDRGNALKKLSGKDLLKSFMHIRRKPDDPLLKHGIYAIRLSPESKTLVSLHMDGRLTLWNFPSMKLSRTWYKSEQPGFNGYSHDAKPDNEFLTNIVDVNWWSEKELLLSVANGALTISSADNLENLLGDSPEKFDYWPTLSQAVNGRVLVLECEQIVTQDGDKTGKSESKQWLNEGDDYEEESSFKYRLKELTKQTLYFLTEAERFLPAIKPARILTNTYRLVCLKSTTPEELYARKIEIEHYGEALDLAHRFNLNTDLVYQRQWKKRAVTKITIHDYLTKIKDRYWVLDECLLRIPDDFDAVEQLLKYGLLGTSWKVIEAIDSLNKEDDTAFILDNSSTEENDETEKEKEKRSSVQLLSDNQKKLCRYRWQLLHYLDRLSTYEVILGGSFKARDKFDANFFLHFRSCNIVYQAVEYARNEDSIALEHIFSYHGKQCLAHWLPIVSNFPETIHVRDFDPVLPEIGESEDEPEILPWLQKHHRDPDWVESENVFLQIQKDIDHDDELGGFIYESQPELKKFHNCQTQRTLLEWFVWRIYDIDEKSRQVSKCCDLAKLAIKRGLTGLTELNEALETLRILTYEVNIDMTLSLKEFLKLSDLSKMKLLMSKTTEQSFVNDYKMFLMPFLNKIGKNSMKTKQNLLHEFMVDIAKTDLTCCLKLFEKCSPQMSEPLIPDVAELMKLVMDCIYICKRDDQLNLAFAIVRCLPSREEGIISSQIEGLHAQLDQLELILGGADILEYHGYPQTISFVLESQKNHNRVVSIIRTLIKNTATKPKAATPEEWNMLLTHLIKLVQGVYTIVDMKICHEMFVEGLLQSGTKQNIQLAAELLRVSRDGQLSPNKGAHLKAALNVLKYDVSTRIVVNAAKEYFNSASSLSDPIMELSRLCLSLIVDKPSVVQEEYDFIDSLKILYEFNVNMLPLQVRLCADKLDIIELCLKEKDTNYKKADKLLKLGDLLKICGEDTKERNGRILIKIAETAFLNHDYSFAAQFCHRLIEENFSNAWEICRHLGECDKYTDYNSRKSLLSFALTYCPIYHIEEILNEKTLLETKILYEKLSCHMNIKKQDGENLTNDVEDDELAISEQTDGIKHSLLKKTTHRTKKILSGVAGTVAGVAGTVAGAAGTMTGVAGTMTGVADARWVSGAMKWVKSSVTQTSAAKDADTEVKSVEYHPYYLSSQQNSDGCGATYNFYEFWEFLQHTRDEEHMFNHLLLRSQKLSERRAQGTVLEDTDEALLILAKSNFKDDSMASLAYLMALSKPSAAESVLGELRKNPFTYIFSSYYCALQLYMEQHQRLSNTIADVYCMEPKSLITFILKTHASGEDLSKSDAGRSLAKYLTGLSDLLQATVLKDLDKGVDIERFASDDEYKKETILGLAMNVDDKLINTCFTLASKYEIALWEVMLAHVEYLFTDSGLKAKEIRDDLNKWKVESVLKENDDIVFERLKTYVYPEIDGKNHNMLLLFYVFLLNCTSPDHVLQGKLSLDSHAKLLKKIKAAAPSLDYKELVHGASPMDVIKASVMENNVHLLAKIASKIPRTDGTFMAPNDVFLAYVVKAFWEPDKTSEKLDWMHHFETCQKFLSKLAILDLQTLADHIIFSQQSFDLLTQEIRLDIVNRLLKYTRQQRGNDQAKLKGSDSLESTMADYDVVISYFESATKHLKCLKSTSYLDLQQSKEESKRLFAKRYDLSKGDEFEIKTIASDMLFSLTEPEVVISLIESSELNIKVGGCLQETIKRMLHDIQSTSDCTSFTSLVNNLKSYVEDGGSVVTEEDVLEVVRPFCSDVNIDTDIKSTVLHILQDVFNLSGEEFSLLLFYQTAGIVSSRWNLKIQREDMNTDASCYNLFCKICDITTNREQLDGLEQLLLAWPILTATIENEYLNQPWLKVIMKCIELKLCDSIVMTTEHAVGQKKLSDEEFFFIYEKLKNVDEFSSYKLLLLSESKPCQDKVFDELKSTMISNVDEEFVSLLLKTKTFHRLSNTSTFQSAIDYVVKRDDDVMTEQVVRLLREHNLECESGTLLMHVNVTHSSFHNIVNSINYLRHKMLY